MTDYPDYAEGTLVWCQFHERALVSLARPRRRAEIDGKPEHERAARHHAYRAVIHPERLPAAVLSAYAAWKLAYAERWRAYAAWKLADAERWRADAEWGRAYAENRAAIVALHREECPDVPYDYEADRLVLPVAPV